MIGVFFCDVMVIGVEDWCWCVENGYVVIEE